MSTGEIRTDTARTVASGLTMLAWNPEDNATVVRDVARRAHLIGEADPTARLLDSLAETTVALGELYRATADHAENVDFFGDPAGIGEMFVAIDGAAARLAGQVGDDVNAFSATDDFNSAMILGSTRSGSGNGVVDAVGGFLLGDLANIWNGGDSGLPVGQLVAGGVRVGRTTSWLLDPARSPDTIPLFNNGGVGVRLSSLLQRSNQLAPVGRWMQSPAGTTLFRRAGIAGGVYGTVTGGWEVIQHGNPVDAYREHGAGYVADVAGTAFSASSTAFLLAPNPATATAVVVTGVVWAGAEIWDHREEIMEWTSEQWDRVTNGVGAAWDTGTAVVGASWDATVAAAGEAQEFVSDVASASWDLGTTAVSTSAGFIGDTASSAWDTGADVVGALDPRDWF